MGVQFWWFYDVIAVAAVLASVFITVKKGFVKSVVSLLGYAMAIGIALSLSTAVADSFYSKAVRSSNIKKLDETITNGDFYGDLSAYLNNLGYNITADSREVERICVAGENVDRKLYEYVNNINNKKVDEAGIFMEKLHEGYASVISGMVSKQLSVYSAEYAVEEIKDNPAAMYPFFSLVNEPDYKRPAAEYIVDTYLKTPYTAQIRLICMLIIMVLIMLITILCESAFAKRAGTKSGIVLNVFSGVIGIFKGAAIVLLIALTVRIYVVLGSNKMLFFNHEAIDSTYIFKYVYDFVRNI